MADIVKVTRTLDITLIGDDDSENLALSLNNGRTNVTRAEVNAAMSGILAAGLYNKNGEQMTTIDSVYLKTVQTVMHEVE